MYEWMMWMELESSKCILNPMTTSTGHRIYKKSSMNQNSNSKCVACIKCEDDDGCGWRLLWKSWMVGFALNSWACMRPLEC